MRQRSRQAVKLNDVASLVNVSPSTVSLFVRYPEKVSVKTGKKIQAAIDELGYVHNKIASQFTGGRSSSMAVIVPSIANIIFSRVIQKIERTVSAAGYQLSIASHDHSLDKEEEQVKAILQWSPAAIAIAGADHNPSTVKMLQNSGIPVVQMWQIEGEHFPAQVGNDHTYVGFQAAQFMIESGCRKLAYFTTRFNDDIRAQKRYQGFIAALDAHALQHVVVDIPCTDNIYQASRSLLMKTLVKERGLDGIFCSSDAIASALLMEAFDKKIQIPQQLSILGYGDFPASAFLAPYSLSSVNLNADDMAAKTAEMMLKMSKDENYQGEIVDVGFEIIPRDSTNLPF